MNRNSLAAALGQVALPLEGIENLGATMRRLIREGLTDLPLPGSGHTAGRWRLLAAVGAADLSLAKLYESHCDARAILAELGHSFAPVDLLAVWAAKTPGVTLTFRGNHDGGELTGRKNWCSGAAVTDEGLLTAMTPEGNSVLVRARLGQPGIRLQGGSWQATGMISADTVALEFAGAAARQVGEPDAYLRRPGFWQGGAGIAAVWLGAAGAVADTLARSRRTPEDPHAAAHLGAVDAAWQAARALLLETAAWVDAHPAADAEIPARRLRASVEAAAAAALERTGRALGAASLCADRAHARRCADLEIFLRQSHAERDLAALGRLTAGQTFSDAW